jgi:hypothetical protein
MYQVFFFFLENRMYQVFNFQVDHWHCLSRKKQKCRHCHIGVGMGMGMGISFLTNCNFAISLCLGSSLKGECSVYLLIV